jgi:hypothetical protein
MTHLVTRISTRPNNSVQFWQASADLIATFTTKYMFTPKILTRTRVRTADGLQEIVTTLWRDFETWQEFVNDEEFVQVRNEQNEHDIAHGITVQSYDFNLG